MTQCAPISMTGSPFQLRALGVCSIIRPLETIRVGSRVTLGASCSPPPWLCPRFVALARGLASQRVVACARAAIGDLDPEHPPDGRGESIDAVESGLLTRPDALHHPVEIVHPRAREPDDECHVLAHSHSTALCLRVLYSGGRE